MHGRSRRLGADFRRRMIRTGAMAVLGAGLLAPAAGCERTGDAGGRPERAADRSGADPTPATSGAASARTPPIVSAPTPTLAIVFDPPTLDLGMIPPNTDKAGTVTIRNDGDAPVRILQVKPTCKCTTINDLVGAVIEPEGAVTLTTELEGQGRYGRRKAAIKFMFEGHEQVLRLDIRAEVALPVKASPTILNLVAGTTNGHVVVESVEGRPFSVLAANRQPPRFVGFDPEIDELRSSYLLEWDLAEELAEKRLPHWWVIETDHPECPIVDSWVRHQTTIEPSLRERSWRVADQRILLGLVEPGQSAEFTVSVTDIGRDSIYTVRSLSREFEARLLTFERAGADGRCTVRITPRADHRGVFQGAVEFMAEVYTHAIDVVGKVAP
jgi:hypothetical protein